MERFVDLLTAMVSWSSRSVTFFFRLPSHKVIPKPPSPTPPHVPYCNNGCVFGCWIVTADQVRRQWEAWVEGLWMHRGRGIRHASCLGTEVG